MKDPLDGLTPSRNVAKRMLELETDLRHARTQLRRYNKSPETLGRWGLDTPEPAQQEEGWFMTYLDMMTLLLVVMIVMLAFSGSLSGILRTSGPTDSDAVLVSDETPHSNEIRKDGASDPAVVSTSNGGATSPPNAVSDVADAATSPTERARPSTLPASASSVENPQGHTGLMAAGGHGLLPGGLGFLPGKSALGDTAIIPNEAGAATSHGAAHPSTVIAAGVQVVPSLEDLYPGWSAQDLAASFVGPPRPSEAGTAKTDGIDGTVTIAPASPARSEGENLAAGLALTELGSDVEVVVNERSVSFRVNSEILFDSSQADLSRPGLAVLRRIMLVLAKTDHDITVEGHTDAVPVRRNVRYPSNWELSSSRAGSVVRYLQANGIDKTRLKAIGYADARPIADNHTPEGRARNRRVELIIEKHH